jgi:hypothetical protein
LRSVIGVVLSVAKNLSCPWRCGRGEAARLPDRAIGHRGRRGRERNRDRVFRALIR